MTDFRGFLGPVEELDRDAEEIVLCAGFAPDQLASATNLNDLPLVLHGASVGRQAAFLAGRLLARCAMERLGLAAVPLQRGPMGEPVWPAPLAGSISHKGHRVVVVLGRGRHHLGIDLECLATANAEAAIRSVVLDAEEASLCADAHAATAVFSAKEAAYKALFPLVRRKFGFSAARLAARPGPAGVHLRLVQDLAPGAMAGQIIPVALLPLKGMILARCRVDRGPCG